MKFVVATYGGKHVGMLLAHLHALRASHPGAPVEVYHQDLPPPLLEALARSHPDVCFTATHFDFARDKIQRISSKTLAWDFAMQRQAEGETVCLLDVDILVLRELQPFFSDPACDIVFTFKDGGFVLNTGVLLCRVNARTRAFFQHWRAETVAILRDPERFGQANDPALPYGAADQMALHQMLGYREGRTHYNVAIAGESVQFRGEPCALLNETRSCPITAQMHIIHFKGGWQPILLDGRRFSRHRPKAVCWEMYLFYLGTFRAALERLNQAVGAHWQPRDFHIHIPRYVEARGRVRQRLLYAGFVAGDYLRDLAALGSGARRVLSAKLRFALLRSGRAAAKTATPDPQ